MRAAVVRTYGGPEAAELIEVPTPDPGPGQVRIRFAAGAISPVDLWTRAGLLTRAGVIPADQDVVGLGWDVAGTVDALGEGVADLAVGDAVIGLLRAFGPPLGSHAEQVVLDRAAVTAAPVTQDAVAAATLPLNGLTALQSVELADVAPGGVLLVTGAAGAVGGFAVEIAAARGIRVVALAREQDADDLRRWGAGTVVTDVADLGAALPAGADAVIDAAGVVDAALDAVRDGGRYVVLTPSLGVPEGRRGIEVRVQDVQADSAQLAELVRLVDAGGLTLRVAAAFPLAEVALAHEAAAKPGVRGRVVLVA